MFESQTFCVNNFWQDANGEGKWLVILNNSLAESEIHRLLRSQQHRIRGEFPEGTNCMAWLLSLVSLVSLVHLPAS